MTTPTPTSSTDNGLPDLAELTQLANAMLNAPPGPSSGASSGVPLPASLPQRPVSFGAPSLPGV
ncbi:MAG: hypothetical protein ACREVL_14845, partial [Solimonas sp.]